jgi:dihydrofolate synthase/folylpolyglutamate synthase
VITSLGFDHTQILGSTLEKIAREKGALFTKDLVISRQALTSTIVTLALERKANVAVAETDEKDYQASNTYTALKAVEFFRKKGIIPFCMEFKEFHSILPKGRFEEVKEGIILDVAHNPQGLEALILKCREKYAEGGTLLLGGYRDKDLVLMVKKHHSYFEKILVWDGGKKNLRMYPKEELKEQLEKLTSRSIGLVQDLDLEHYLGEEKRGLLLITGGFAIVREARERLRGLLNP